jgi:hypothetical protein
MMRRTAVFGSALLLASAMGFPSSSPRAAGQDAAVTAPAAQPAAAAALHQAIAKMEEFLPQLPDRAPGLYRLAVYHQRLGETAEALKALRECLELHEGFDPAGSPTLGKLKGTKEFDEMVEGVHRELPVVARARQAFVTSEADLEPEGLAYDARQNVFYLSSLNRRKIVRMTPQGSESDFLPADRDNLLPILGIRPDPSDGTVWAASWDEDGDRSELLHFDARGGLLGRYAHPEAAKHGFNDLVVRCGTGPAAATCEVIVTDSASNQVYRFDPAAHTFAAIHVHRTLYGPNGITLGGGGRLLFVADDFGVVRIDLAAGSSSEVKRGERSTLAGIDGLYWRKGSLIAVQNGNGSPRLAAFRLSPDGTRVVETTVLENRTEFTGHPTTGAIRENEFYFLANADPGQAVRIGALRLPTN